MSKESLFQWTRTQRNGVLGLIILIVIGQLLYFFIDFPSEEKLSVEEFAQFQRKIDTIKIRNTEKITKIYPFNPNFLTDYKAYQLGISAEELVRLQMYREEGKFVNSVQEFQQVTQISDSLLTEISPFFKFPEWVTKSKRNYENVEKNIKSLKKNIQKNDINTASEEDLKKIYGIGDKLSQRIIKYRERLQGFSLNEQLSEVYGLEDEVIERVWEQFEIKTLPKINKVDINSASKSELSKIPYISYQEAEEIILYRSQVGIIKDLDELLQIKFFDKAKITKIKLYLSTQIENVEKNEF